MRVLNVSTGADVAGNGYQLTQAFADTDIEVRSAARRRTWIGYPEDLSWSQVPHEWARADAVHLHGTMRALRMFGHKPFVLHHHGTKYRTNPDVFNDAVNDLNGRAIVSTIDLLAYGDNLTWSPHPVNIAELEAYRKPQTGKLRVGHAPTRRAIKSTDAFLAACDRLNVEPVLIERHTWTNCLRIKGTIDVLFDQVQLGYGCNAIEAWAMGIPVIAGATPWTLRRMRDEFGPLPFYTATEASIADAINAMRDPAVREEWAVRGKNHVHRWHDGTETVARLSRIYRGLV